MDALAGEFALHHQCDEHLPAHETKAGSLRRLIVDQELHADVEPLADTPGSPRRLSQGMERVAGLVEVDRREPQQIESYLDQLGVTDENIDSIRDPLPAPMLPFQRRHR